MSLTKLSDENLHRATVRAAKEEQALTIRVLRHLNEVERRRLFAKHGFATLSEYGVKLLGYNESGISQRIQAMRLMFGVPGAKEKIENGQISFSNAFHLQRHFNKEKGLSQRDQTKIVEQAAGKSYRELKRTLRRQAPPPKRKTVTITLEVDMETMAMLRRVIDLRGRKEYSQLFKMILRAYLRREDPLRRKVSLETSQVGNPRSRHVSRDLAARVAQRSGGRCEYFSPINAKRCETRYRLQIDHIKPFAKGGLTTYQNLRHLCFHHNQLLSQETFGKRYQRGMPAA